MDCNENSPTKYLRMDRVQHLTCHHHLVSVSCFTGSLRRLGTGSWLINSQYKPVVFTSRGTG